MDGEAWQATVHGITKSRTQLGNITLLGNYLGQHSYIVLCVVCGEGNGDPLQYSCLENPMDGGAW